jgi:hypothetical protein
MRTTSMPELTHHRGGTVPEVGGLCTFCFKWVPKSNSCMTVSASVVTACRSRATTPLVAPTYELKHTSDWQLWSSEVAGQHRGVPLKHYTPPMALLWALIHLTALAASLVCSGISFVH